jgi:hypothetical protein
VSRLESSGDRARLTERLATDARLRARVDEALTRYRARRDAHEPIPDSGAPPGGGSDRIKCLHAHVAHELADAPNPVGARGLARAGFPDCAMPCVMIER